MTTQISAFGSFRNAGLRAIVCPPRKVTSMPTKAATPRRPLVLVVDDDPDLRALARLQLSDGFDVLQAASGPECVALAAAHAPDVILLDMMMPGMDGGQVLTALAKDSATRDIPVVFLSALDQTEDRVRGLENGAVDWITKPVDSRELVARVGAAARTKARQEELRSIITGDGLTGLRDRKAFTARLAEEVARARRSSAPLSVLLIDVDHLERVNEEVSREAGDDLLRSIAGLLRDNLRSSDAIFRYDGDEFAAVLPDTDVSAAFLAAERCRHGVHALDGSFGTATLSIGIAELAGRQGAEEIVAKAEIALFKARESGGDRSWRADDPRRHGLNPIALSEELTDREWAVLSHLANRRTETDIARRLGIAAGTVRSHKARIRRKLHVDPDMRLAEFARAHFRELVSRLDRIESA
jgi:diguanylate cyclase (GGDEF)-like protein